MNAEKNRNQPDFSVRVLQNSNGFNLSNSDAIYVLGDDFDESCVGLTRGV
jgi:hypothetical protein